MDRGATTRGRGGRRGSTFFGWHESCTKNTPKYPLRFNVDVSIGTTWAIVPGVMRCEMFYVTMTDKFMSGWGRANGKINKFVVVCDTLEQAYGVYKAATDREEMCHVNYTDKRPRYLSGRYMVTQSHVSELGEVWRKYISKSDPLCVNL